MLAAAAWPAWAVIPAPQAGARQAGGVLRVTRHEHAASLIVSMAGTVILWLPATTS
jgi:hypothetical protein